jgi:hypothetical protein
LKYKTKGEEGKRREQDGREGIEKGMEDSDRNKIVRGNAKKKKKQG